MNKAKTKLLISIITALALTFVPMRAIAQEYNCGAYGAGDFGEGNCIDSDLADTGDNVMWLRIAGIVLLLLALALAYYAYRKRNSKNTSAKVSK